MRAGSKLSNGTLKGTQNFVSLFCIVRGADGSAATSELSFGDSIPFFCFWCISVVHVTARLYFIFHAVHHGNAAHVSAITYTNSE